MMAQQTDVCPSMWMVSQSTGSAGQLHGDGARHRRTPINGFMV